MEVSVPDSVADSQVPLVSRTEICDIRAVQLSAEVYVIDLPDQISATVNVSDLEYAVHDRRLSVRVAHKVDFRTASPDMDTLSRMGGKLAEIQVAHVAELSIDGNAPDPSEVDDLFKSNTIFMIHPYVRSAIHRLTVEVGLPSVVLPYLRR
jgi:hypothetical protein